MNIAVSINREYYKPFLVMLTSLAQKNSDFDLYMLEAEPLEKWQYEQIAKICEEHGSNLFIVKVPVELECDSRFSRSSMSRILIPYILPRGIGRVLYLDADILVNGSLLGLYSIEMNNKGICAIPDITVDEENGYYMKELSLKRPYHYINSGVLLIDTEEVSRKYSFDEVYAALRNNKPISRLIDQDFINSFFRDDICYEKETYNYVPTWRNWIKAYFGSGGRNPVIIHYMGDDKPWSPEYSLAFYFEYRKVWNMVNDKIDKKTYILNVIRKAKGILIGKFRSREGNG